MGSRWQCRRRVHCHKVLFFCFPEVYDADLVGSDDLIASVQAKSASAGMPNSFMGNQSSRDFTWLVVCLGPPGPWLLTIGLQYTVSPWIRLVAAFLQVKNACRKMATQVDTNLRYIQFSAVKRLSREDSANPLCSRVSKALAQC